MRCRIIKMLLRVMATGTTRRSTRCRGTSRGTEVDSCGIGMATTPTATRGLPCGSRPRHPRNPRGSVNAFWTRRTRHAGRFPAFFGSPTPRAWWESFRNTRGPGKGRRRSHRPILFNNLNRPSLRLIERFKTISPSISNRDDRERGRMDLSLDERRYFFSSLFLFLFLGEIFVILYSTRSPCEKNERKKEKSVHGTCIVSNLIWKM